VNQKPHALDQPGQRLTVGAVAEADVEPLEHREAAIRGRVNVELDGLRSQLERRRAGLSRQPRTLEILRQAALAR